MTPGTKSCCAARDTFVDLVAPCPFCGSLLGVVEQVERFGRPPPAADPADGWWNWRVRCNACACEGPPSKAGRESALRLWARRPGGAA